MSELYRDFIDRKTNDIINILDGVITPTATAELYRDFINIKANDVITALNGTITPPPAGVELYRDFLNRKFNDVIAGIGSYIPPVSFPTVSGSIVTFNSQYVGLPLKSHKIALTATQSGSGTPSPDNVRPISGWSAINISQSGADTSTPTVYTINLGGTYYGGEYDARTGLLTITHMFVNCTSANEFNRNNGFVAYRMDGLPQARGRLYAISNMISEFGSFISSNMTKNIIQTPDTTTMYIALNEDISIDLLDVLYELATPTTIQLPPCPIDTLEGVNNIWADTGNTTLQYIKIGGNT